MFVIDLRGEKWNKYFHFFRNFPTMHTGITFIFIANKVPEEFIPFPEIGVMFRKCSRSTNVPF